MSADDLPLTITMSRSQWVAVIAVLSAAPYGQVAALIEAIAQQAGAQLEAREPQPETATRAN
jgi:hypothetical protein